MQSTSNSKKSVLALFLLLSLIYFTQCLHPSKNLNNSPEGRLLQASDEGCLRYDTKDGSCLLCYDEYEMNDGTCVYRYQLSGLLYTTSGHAVNWNIDYKGTTVAVDVVFGIMAAAVFGALGFLIFKEDWTKLVPPEENETKGKPGAKEGEKEVQQPQQAKGTNTTLSPKAKGVEDDQGVDLGGTKKGGHDEEDDMETGTGKKKGDEAEEEEEEGEEVYYPDLKRTSDNGKEKVKNAPKIEEEDEGDETDRRHEENSKVEVQIEEEDEEQGEEDIRDGRPSHKSHKSHKSNKSAKSHQSSKHGSPPKASRSNTNQSHAEDHEEEDENEPYEEKQEEEEQEEEEKQEEEAENGSKHDEELEEEDEVMDLDAAFNDGGPKAQGDDEFDPNSSNTGFMNADSKRY